jgi:hypothetical protein
VKCCFGLWALGLGFGIRCGAPAASVKQGEEVGEILELHCTILYPDTSTLGAPKLEIADRGRPQTLRRNWDTFPSGLWKRLLGRPAWLRRFGTLTRRALQLCTPNMPKMPTSHKYALKSTRTPHPCDVCSNAVGRAHAVPF